MFWILGQDIVDLNSLTRDRTSISCMRRQSFNQWTSWEIPKGLFPFHWQHMTVFPLLVTWSFLAHQNKSSEEECGSLLLESLRLTFSRHVSRYVYYKELSSSIKWQTFPHFYFFMPLKIVKMLYKIQTGSIQLKIFRPYDSMKMMCIQQNLYFAFWSFPIAVVSDLRLIHGAGQW